MQNEWNFLLLLNAGLLLFLALFIGKIFTAFKIPKITAYLLIGILLGPQILGTRVPFLEDSILSLPILDSYTVLTEMVLGLILFNIGGEFQLENFKSFGKKIVWVSFGESFLSCIFVFSLCFLGFFVVSEGLDWGLHLKYSWILGVIAIATAPAATLLVLREYESEGPLTDRILVLVGLNNILCIVMFKFSFSFLFQESSFFFEPFLEVLISIALGIGIGLVLSFLEKWLEKDIEHLFLIFSGVTLTTGFTFFIQGFFPNLSISVLLANLFLGITWINASPQGDKSFQVLKRVDMPLYALFFVFAGAQLHIDEFIRGGWLFVAYVLGRFLGKMLGSIWSSNRVGNKTMGKNLGFGILPQAGVAIGLALILKEELSFMGDELATVVLSSALFFELSGPFFTRLAIIRSGEVKALSLRQKRSLLTKRRYLRVLVRLRQTLGISTRRRRKTRQTEIYCKDIMRSNIEPIVDFAFLEEVLQFASHCKYDPFPVVDAEKHFVGTISHSQIRGFLLDSEFSHLIIARDMMNESPTIAYPNDSLEKVLKSFHHSKENPNAIAVIDGKDSGHLIGMVTQKDLLDAYRKS